ncbi:3-deoxy-7-phosphoheptulonate synthase [Streptomyces paromomycinus]|uniref:3-deoxy-7-phosphoheptulonate synthase n=1 Tax=Streptomyces paromomycinus TaxID=92743 RepID=A0A401VVD6_STREY|nr:3-deoxy-7-phosphoheptulonate synthase [Streptomyces paromomycinus]GCD41035.1 phospho-2-dehydro-3-deoxyheptonate aldolase [Streptomyces paromomycinus]
MTYPLSTPQDPARAVPKERTTMTTSTGTPGTPGTPHIRHPDGRRVRPTGGQTRVLPVESPAQLCERLPLTYHAAHTVRTARHDAVRVLDGRDDRLLVIVGPCSVHDRAAALDYASRLRDAAAALADDLLVVMRVYVEKPRTCLGWPGLVGDPGLDGGADLGRGLAEARSLMLDIAESGLPVGCEWVNPATPAYLSDVVAWGSVGARTASSQVHRDMASGLPMPVGVKNGTDGSVQVAVDAVRAAAAPHTFLGASGAGPVSVLRTSGNPDCHVVLRGGTDGPNYGAAHVHRAAELLAGAGLPVRVVVDASHGNSGKQHERQRVVADDLAMRIADGDTTVRGLLLESFLVPGRQDAGAGRQLVFGQSVTDACIGWSGTAQLLRELAGAARARRASRPRHRRTADPGSAVLGTTPFLERT